MPTIYPKPAAVYLRTYRPTVELTPTPPPIIPAPAPLAGSSGNYAMRLGTASGGYLQIPLNSNGRMEFWDGSSVVEVVNLPDSPPPAGFFPIGIPGGSPALVPYTLLALSVETIGNLVRGRFQSEVELAKGMLTQYDNGPPVQPDPTAGPWASVSVSFGSGTELFEGDTGDFLTRGTLMVELRDRIGVGDGDLLFCADAVDDAFRYAIDDPIRYGGPELRTVGQEQGKTGTAWWRVDVAVTFAVDRPN